MIMIQICHQEKTSRLRWARNVARTNENNLIKKVCSADSFGARKRGRLRLRWKEGINKDAAKIDAPN